MCIIIGSDGDWEGRRTEYRAHRLVSNGRGVGEGRGGTYRSTRRGCLSLYRRCLMFLVASLGLITYPVLPSSPLSMSGCRYMFKGPYFPAQSTWPIGDPPSGRARGHALCPELPSLGCHDRVESLVTGKSFMAPAS